MSNFLQENFIENGGSLQYAIKRVEKHTKTQFHPHWHNYYEIIYCESGVSEIIGLNQNIRLKENSLALIPPNYIHDTRISNGSFKIIVLQFSMVFLDSFLKNQTILSFTKQITPNKVTICDDKSQYAYSILLKIVEEHNAIQLTSNPIIQANIFLIMSLIFKNSQLNINYAEQNTNSNFNLSEIKEYIQSNLSCKISLSKTANEFHYSPTYFSKIFKANTGISFKDYINSLKIEKAQHLLISEGMKPKEISEILNYESPQNFSRIYKSKTGFSPSNHKKILMKTASLYNK